MIRSQSIFVFERMREQPAILTFSGNYASEVLRGYMARHFPLWVEIDVTEIYAQFDREEMVRVLSSSEERLPMLYIRSMGWRLYRPKKGVMYGVGDDAGVREVFAGGSREV